MIVASVNDCCDYKSSLICAQSMEDWLLRPRRAEIVAAFPQCGPQAHTLAAHCCSSHFQSYRSQLQRGNYSFFLNRKHNFVHVINFIRLSYSESLLLKAGD